MNAILRQDVPKVVAHRNSIVSSGSFANPRSNYVIKAHSLERPKMITRPD